MTLQIELTPEMEAEVAAAAHRKGVDPSTYALQILNDSLLEERLVKAKTNPMPMSEFLDKMAQFSNKIPDYPGETFDRAFIYGDHD